MQVHIQNNNSKEKDHRWWVNGESSLRLLVENAREAIENANFKMNEKCIPNELSDVY